jgi:predicted nucleic acid-binding protein
MAWVVDTCLLIDIATTDPQFGIASVSLLDAYRPFGLVIPPVVYVELAPVFTGDLQGIDAFLGLQSIAHNAWKRSHTFDSFKAWYRHTLARRSGTIKRRPIADIQIGAFACQYEGLLTRNPSDFVLTFPQLAIVTP